MKTTRAGLVRPATAGLLGALSLPPWGWWPLAFVAIAILASALDGRPWRGRVAVGAAFGVGLFVPGLWWMGEFNLVGAALAVVIETSFVVAATALTPPGRGRLVALPAALVVAEWARGHAPFGGVPMAGLALGQVSGPLRGGARVGGALLVLWLAATGGTALASLARRRLGSSVMLALVVLVAVVGSAGAPDGGGGPLRRIAIVQGGGTRGFRAIHSDPSAVLNAHLLASDRIRPPVDLALWPEDVIDVSTAGSIDGSPEADDMAAVARRIGAPVVAGVVEDAGPDHFRNASVVWAGDGQIIDRYDKVHRVPFGEYVPGRSLIKHVVNLDVIARDALPGSGPGVLRTPAGSFGVVISFEVFFADRARAATRAGGRLLLVPTNASSFKTSQVPSTEVATAQLRAIENGRDVAQAAPTGYGGFIDHRGRLLARTTLSRRQVLERALHLRSGRTIYVRVGDGPVLAAAAFVVLAAWRAERRLRRRSRRPAPP